MAFVSDIPPAIRAEAAAWLARLRADDKSAADEAAFRAWIAANPHHARAFEAITEAWEIAGAACVEPVAGLSHREPAPHRRAVLASVGALAMAGVGFALWQGAEARVYETGVGEQKHAVLPDGTQIFLDTDTRIRVSYDSRMRIVALENGRCSFHVMEGDPRLFAVDTAAERILAARSSFDVRRDGDAVCVVVTQGLATMSARDGGWQESLASGDRMVVEHGRNRKDHPNLVALLAWQTGQVVFDNETLDGAIREMNRYSVVKIAVANADVGNMRISGVYRVGDNAAFAHSVAVLLPVVLDFKPNQVRLERDPARAKKT